MKHELIKIEDHLLVVSNEEIKKYDWVFHPIYKSIYQWIENAEKKFDRIDAKKIILTTDRDLIKDGVQAIDDKLLEWFIKNPNCKEVYIHKEYKQINQDNPITRGSTALVFSHYEIIIPQEILIIKNN